MKFPNSQLPDFGQQFSFAADAFSSSSEFTLHRRKMSSLISLRLLSRIQPLCQSQRILAPTYRCKHYWEEQKVHPLPKKFWKKPVAMPDMSTNYVTRQPFQDPRNTWTYDLRYVWAIIFFFWALLGIHVKWYIAWLQRGKDYYMDVNK